MTPVLVATALVILSSPPSVGAQASDEGGFAQDQHLHVSENAAAMFPAREASGTSWVPVVTPMFGIGRTYSGWSVMLEGRAFAQFIYEPGDTHRTGGFGSRQVSSVNWGMLMARRPLGGGRLGVRGMLSLEPWTVTNCGYLNLLATGEMCEGDTIHDRQHPHDLFMEVAGDYDRPLRGSLRWQIYGGLAGEPALGPTAFPHRLSALVNPVAPISHHWLDSSHITFGLVTAGLYQRRWKAELSVFNGREPDQNRANFDLGALDSIAARLSLLPSDRLALQVSTGHLREAEAQFPPWPPSTVNRTTASATYHRPVRGVGVWATTAAYGVNSGPEVIAGRSFDTVTHAVLVESTIVSEPHTWFSRIEVVGKPAHDLHAHEFTTDTFTVGKLEIGYSRTLGPWGKAVSEVGAIMTANLLPPDLAPRYGGRLAPGVCVFVSFRPNRHQM